MWPCAFQEAKKLGQTIQCELFEDERYLYHKFCTNLGGKAHKIIAEYYKKADVENLVGETKREEGVMYQICCVIVDRLLKTCSG